METIRTGTPKAVQTLVLGVSHKGLKSVAEKCSPDERMKIARVALKNWDLRNAITVAKVSYNSRIIFSNV